MNFQVLRRSRRDGLAGFCFFHPAIRQVRKCRGRKTTRTAGRAYIRRPVAGNQLKEPESVDEYDRRSLI